MRGPCEYYHLLISGWNIGVADQQRIIKAMKRRYLKNESHYDPPCNRRFSRNPGQVPKENGRSNQRQDIAVTRNTRRNRQSKD